MIDEEVLSELERVEARIDRLGSTVDLLCGLRMEPERNDVFRAVMIGVLIGAIWTLFLTRKIE